MEATQNCSSNHSTKQTKVDRRDVKNRHPALGDQTLMRHVQVEQVQRVVNRLDLADFHEPVLEVLGSGDQHAMTMILSLSQDSVQVLDSCLGVNGHFAAVSRRFWAWIESRAESFANLLDANLELITLEEDDEDGLVDVVALWNFR
jgi:hypothetical protein